MRSRKSASSLRRSTSLVRLGALEERLPPGTILALPFTDLGFGLLSEARAAEATRLMPTPLDYSGRVGSQHATLDATSRLLPKHLEQRDGARHLTESGTAFQGLVVGMPLPVDFAGFAGEGEPFAHLLDASRRHPAHPGYADNSLENVSSAERDLAILDRGVLALDVFASPNWADERPSGDSGSLARTGPGRDAQWAICLRQRRFR